MVKENNKPINKKEIEKLFSQQTTDIAGIVDNRLDKFEQKMTGKMDRRLDKFEQKITGKIDTRLGKFEQKMTKKVDGLLSQQTIVILNAVDKKLEKFEENVSARVDKLCTSIDKFVTLYTKQEQEFTFIIEDIRKIKEVIKEKLGVEIA